MSQAHCKTVVLISGSGTNLQSFIDQAASGRINLDLRLVFSNRPDAYGLTRAFDAGIDTAVIEHGKFRDREAFDQAVAKTLDACGPELLILAGFMRILSPWFVRHYEGRILNIHPALLPAYPGLDTHRRVLDAGVTVAIASNCNPGSSYTTSISFCIAIAVRDMGMTIDEAIRAVTTGGAAALRRTDVGRLSPGSAGHAVILDAPSHHHLAYRPGVPLIRQTIGPLGS